MVVITLPISTTNITGFLTCTRGSSFLKDAGMAARMILGSQIEMAPLRRVFHCLTSNSSVCILEHLPYIHQQLFDDRPQRVGREVRECSYNQNDADQERDPERPRGGEGAQSRRHDTLFDQCST